MAGGGVRSSEFRVQSSERVKITGKMAFSLSGGEEVCRFVLS